MPGTSRAYVSDNVTLAVMLDHHSSSCSRLGLLSCATREQLNSAPTNAALKASLFWLEDLPVAFSYACLQPYG